MSPFRVVVAPDKFKGSLSADEVAAVLGQALGRPPGVEVVQHPVADGGEGTVALALSVGFEAVDVTVSGPLGDPVEATFAIRDEVAILEMAAAAGLGLLPGPPDVRTARSATTRGVGELILAAAERGATRIVVGAGGSASTDGGAGALRAMGVDLMPADGSPRRLDQRPTCLDPRLAEVNLVVASDVDNPLLGPAGAASVFAPQKGADAATVAALEHRLEDWAATVAATTGADLRDLPGGGAAGGLAFGLAAVGGARLVPGAALLLELTGFDRLVRTADLVIVGEGSLDAQSLRGKGPIGVARATSQHDVPVIAVAGRNELQEGDWRDAGLRAVYSLTDLEDDPEICMQDARRLLCELASSIADDWLPRRPGGPCAVASSTLGSPDQTPPTAQEYRAALLSTLDPDPNPAQESD
ncbi:MAG: glycerate kinase [Nocardioides sp.]